MLKNQSISIFFKVYSKHTKDREKERNKLEEKAIKSNTVIQSFTVTPNCNINSNIIPSIPLLITMARAPRSCLKKRNKSFEEVKIYCHNNMKIIAESLPIHYQWNAEHRASDPKSQILRLAKFFKKIVLYEKFLKYSEWSFIIILSLSMSKLPSRELVLSSVFFIPTSFYILHCGDPRVEISFPFTKPIHELNKKKC